MYTYMCNFSFNLPLVFDRIVSGSRCGIVLNKLVHIAGPPFFFIIITNLCVLGFTVQDIFIRWLSVG